MAERALLKLLFALLLAAAAPAQEVGSAVCAQCHPAVARRYETTPMARSSGSVNAIRPALPAAPITDPSTQAAIRLKRIPEGSLALTLERESPPLSVTRDLMYFVGSGRIGRSFLFSPRDGFLYQSPVSWYADGNTWRASPGFGRKNTVDLTRAVEPACLLCHASRLQPVPATQNGYDPKQPFLEGGISCERCHGPGGRHAAAMKAARPPRDRAIVNPAKLAAAERDSVCAQCHLTGAARIARAATKGRNSFTPGDDLARTVAVFVWQDAKDTGLTVTSHFETLNWSRCKQAVGDRLWCGTCHTPHGAAIDVRQRCIGCHAATVKTCSLDPAARRARNNDKCQGCHMPASEVRDAEHAVYTDHSIPRLPRTRPEASSSKELVPFLKGAPADARDLALAYAVTALIEPAVRRRAFELLRAAAANDPADLAVAAQLAQFYDRTGQPAEALPLYERVVAGDPANTAALINLGTLYAQAGRLPDAAALWQKALTRNPALTQARMNLAVAQIRQGDRDAGIESLRRALEWDPENPAVARMLASAGR